MIFHRAFTPGFKFDNGHVVGPSGIPRPTKYRNRERKAAQHRHNLQSRGDASRGRNLAPARKK